MKFLFNNRLDVGLKCGERAERYKKTRLDISKIDSNAIASVAAIKMTDNYHRLMNVDLTIGLIRTQLTDK